MARLLVRQKLVSARERFTVTDEAGYPVYQSEGSLFQIPKRFTIRDVRGGKLAELRRKPISLLPKFVLLIDGRPVATISKELSLLVPRYRVEGQGLQVRGDIFNMNFDIFRNQHLIGKVDKKWITLRDTYAIETYDNRYELVVVGIVLAVDYVKRLNARARRRRSSSN